MNNQRSEIQLLVGTEIFLFSIACRLGEAHPDSHVKGMIYEIKDK
jgi:hypothetical protein